MPPEILTANGMFVGWRHGGSRGIVREYLQTKDPLHINAMWLLAKIGMKHNILDDAELLLEGMLSIKPDHHVARHDYAITLALVTSIARAMQEIGKLLEEDPTNRAYRTTRAAILMGLGKHDKALPLYREVLAETPADPDLHLSIAHALKTLEGPRRPSPPTARPPRSGRATERRTGASRTSRNTASRSRKSPACAPKSERRASLSPTAITCASRSARRSRIAANTPNPSPTTSAAMR